MPASPRVYGAGPGCKSALRSSIKEVLQFPALNLGTWRAREIKVGKQLYFHLHKLLLLFIVIYGKDLLKKKLKGSKQ